MKIKQIVLCFCLIPVAAWAAERDNNARVGVIRSTSPAVKMVAATPVKQSSTNAPVATVEQRSVEVTETISAASEPAPVDPVAESESCREVYRQCMDDFCLLDETEGNRCACSDNIEKSKSLIQEIQKIQSEADELYTTGVEREKLGAKAKLVFGESAAAKKSAARSGIDFSSWLSGGVEDEELGSDADIGSGLYSMAVEGCAAELAKCGSKAKAEETLYSRLIVQDCKAFQSYLADQKNEATMNKRTAESAVRKARFEMLNTTNKYNRGECLLVFRSCIADKGGCGVNFENCLDSGLLERRSHACEDVLDQCMAVRKDVLSDWEEESVSVLADAAKYADRNMRATCLAKIQNCLEESCSTSTETACLTDVNVAAGICPIITECNAKVPGIQGAINDKLGYLQTKKCEQDIDSCLKDKCGTDFTKPECVGKGARDIADNLCPQSMFPSCKGAAQFDVIVNSAMLHMDYQLLTGCINQFSEKLTAVCGTDMNCLPVSSLVPAIDSWIDLKSTAGKNLQEQTAQMAEAAVETFFKEFDKDMTLSACQDVYGKSSTRVRGRSSVKDNVNLTAKMIAKLNAKARADRELASIMDELKIKEETDRNQKYCLQKYKEEHKPSDEDAKNYSYIRSVNYEPDLRNCHVCRVQQVCETGGEKKATSALKAAAGGLATGASAGTMVSPGWGTAIGAVIGGVGAGILGAASGGQEDFCQELESCEDINIGNVTEEMLSNL